MKYVTNKTETKDWGLVSWSMYQAEKQVDLHYTIETLDAILVSAGGFTAFTIVFFTFIFGWYSQYKFESNLGNQLYQAEKKKRKTEQKDNLMEVSECIANRREFTF